MISDYASRKDYYYLLQYFFSQLKFPLNKSRWKFTNDLILQASFMYFY